MSANKEGIERVEMLPAGAVEAKPLGNAATHPLGVLRSGILGVLLKKELGGVTRLGQQVGNLGVRVGMGTSTKMPIY